MSDFALDVKNLSIQFETHKGQIKALRSVNLRIPQKKVVGVVGESGCGKSTLILAVMRLLAENAQVGSGEIWFEGNDLLKAGKQKLRNIRGNRISMIFQDPMTSLNPVRNIGKQLIDTLYREKISRAEKKQRVINMLQTVGIPDPQDRMGQYPHHFSGGMRQRITIAMALLANPALLIADEPTTALDATLEVQIINLLKDLQKRIGCAILFVSHHLNVIAELCDYVMVMYAGEAIEYGTVKEIFTRPSHPYTQALLRCDPAVITEKTRNLPTIPGEIPSLVHLPEGCIFVNRCTYKTDRCLKVSPESKRLTNTHFATCFNNQDYGKNETHTEN